jgi:hypothetical protein
MINIANPFYTWVWNILTSFFFCLSKRIENIRLQYNRTPKWVAKYVRPVLLYRQATHCETNLFRSTNNLREFPLTFFVVNIQNAWGKFNNYDVSRAGNPVIISLVVIAVTDNYTRIFVLCCVLPIKAGQGFNVWHRQQFRATVIRYPKGKV